MVRVVEKEGALGGGVHWSHVWHGWLEYLALT